MLLKSGAKLLIFFELQAFVFVFLLFINDI